MLLTGLKTQRPGRPTGQGSPQWSTSGAPAYHTAFMRNFEVYITDSCPATNEDDAHIFLYCPFFADIGDNQYKMAAIWHPRDLRAIRETAWKVYVRKIIYGSKDWPSRYWEGVVPSPEAPLTISNAQVGHDIAIVTTTRVMGRLNSYKYESKAGTRGEFPARPVGE